MSKSIADLRIEFQQKYDTLDNTKNDFAIGDRVRVITPCADFYFFDCETQNTYGNVERIYPGSNHSSISVRWEEPRHYESGYIQKTFCFSPQDMVLIEKKKPVAKWIEKLKLNNKPMSLDEATEQLKKDEPITQFSFDIPNHNDLSGVSVTEEGFDISSDYLVIMLNSMKKMDAGEIKATFENSRKLGGKDLIITIRDRDFKEEKNVRTISKLKLLNTVLSYIFVGTAFVGVYKLFILGE